MVPFSPSNLTQLQKSVPFIHLMHRHHYQSLLRINGKTAVVTLSQDWKCFMQPNGLLDVIDFILYFSF